MFRWNPRKKEFHRRGNQKKISTIYLEKYPPTAPSIQSSSTTAPEAKTVRRQDNPSPETASQALIIDPNSAILGSQKKSTVSCSILIGKINRLKERLEEKTVGKELLQQISESVRDLRLRIEEIEKLPDSQRIPLELDWIQGKLEIAELDRSECEAELRAAKEKKETSRYTELRAKRNGKEGEVRSLVSFAKENGGALWDQLPAATRTRFNEKFEKYGERISRDVAQAATRMFRSRRK